jgi:CSLREA domain-containing protein
MKTSSSIRFVVADAILLAILLALPVVEASRSIASLQQLNKKPSGKIALLASGRGWPELTLQDGRELTNATDRDDDDDQQLPMVPTALAQGDFNNDGIADLVTSYSQTGGGEVEVRFGNGKGEFAAPIRTWLTAENPTALLADDFTGDGNLDLIIGYGDQPVVSYFAGTGQGTFEWQAEIDLGLTTAALTAGDFNQDGVLDLVVASDSSLLAILPGTSQGNFGSARFLSAEPSGAIVGLSAVQAADLDNDGRLDLVIAYRGQLSEVAVLYGQAGGQFSFPMKLGSGGYLESLAIGDFNADGRMDIAASDPGTNTVGVFFGAANRRFSTPTTVYAGALPGPMAKANLNGDGYPDLAIINRGSSQVSVLLSSGATFQDPVMLDVSSNPIAIVAGRFNDDSLDDLAVAKTGGQGLVVSVTAPPTITVNTAADAVAQDSKVSLREAILAANGQAPNSDVPSDRGKAPDVIGFNIPAAEATQGVFIIRLSASLGALPALTDGGTTIDGASQTGFNRTPIIALDGSAVGAVDGVTITSSLNGVRSLAIGGFGGNGVKISGTGDTPVTGNIVAGCIIGGRNRGNGLSGVVVAGRSVDNTTVGGTDALDRNVISGNGSDGVQIAAQARNTQVIGNAIGVIGGDQTTLANGGNGVWVSGSDNTTIGGTQETAINVISGNQRNGIQALASSGLRIQRNRIGVNAAGSERVANGGDGIALSGDVVGALVGGTTTAGRNIISGNGGNGITLVRSTNNRIQGNYIGTDADGRRAIGNGNHGILVDGGSPNNLIGGADGAGNLISGNTGAGVFISQDALNTVLVANVIGLDSTTQAVLGNGGDGVTISGGGNNVIGGEAAARNFIGGNAGDGVKILNSVNNRVAGNVIGTNAAGTTALRNGGNGVLILGAEGVASQNVVSGNVIAYNQGAGVKIVSFGTGNKVSQNSIYANGGLGIERGGRSALPRITGITNNGGGSITVNGVYGGSAPEGATIEVFLADPDPSGRGEGRTYLGSTKADARGGFSLTLGGRANNEPITATATDFRNDTSEFSENFVVDTTAPTVTVVLPNGGEAIRSGRTLCITWRASDNVGVVSAEVLLSTDGGINFSRIGSTRDNVQRFCWDVPRDLATDRARIRVVVRDAAGNAGQDDSDANFVIDPNAPVVTVVIPNGGEIIPGSSTYRILWEALGNIASCDVAVSGNGGGSYTPLVSGLDGSIRSYLWSPAPLSTKQGRIRVTCTDNLSRRAVDDSDADFVVDSVTPTVTVFTPNGGEVVRGGTTFRIQWASTDDVGVGTQDLMLSTDGGINFVPLPDARGRRVTGLAGNAQSFDWSVPFDLESNEARVCVRARDTAGNEIQDCSDSNFTIVEVPPSVTVLSPNGGEIIRGGDTVAITWTSSDSIVAHDIYLSTDGGATFPIRIIAGLPSTAQSYNWTVPATVSTARGRIRVVARNVAGRVGQDESDSDFIIDSQRPTVRVVSPNGREVFRGNETFEILWKAADDVRLVRQTVQISVDGGATYSDIVTLDGNDPQTFRWKVPLTLFTLNGRIRVIVEDVAGKITQDDSDADFWTIPFENEPPFIKVGNPNGGEIVCAGEPYTIRWQSSDNTAVQFQDILLSVDGGATFNPIAERLPGTAQAYDWAVPAGLSTTRAVIQIRVRDYAGNTVSDVSDRIFAIDGVNPRVSEVMVGPGLSFLGRQTMNITWVSSDDVQLAGHVVEFSRDNGVTWTQIATLSASARSFDFAIPANAGTNDGRIRVTARDTCGRTGQAVSPKFFIIPTG